MTLCNLVNDSDQNFEAVFQHEIVEVAYECFVTQPPNWSKSAYKECIYLYCSLAQRAQNRLDQLRSRLPQLVTNLILKVEAT
jgi:hypothetical protein